MSNKSILERFWIGAKLGWNTPTLPENIIKLNNEPYIRVFRVLGGLTYLFLITKSYNYTSFYLIFPCMFISMIYLFYHFYLSYHIIKHIRKLWKYDIFDVRNSPLFQFIKLSARILSCLHGTCDVLYPTGLALGYMESTDEVLKAGDKAPFFLPLIGSLIKTTFPGKVETPEYIRTIINNKIIELQRNVSDMNSTNDIINQIAKAPGITAEEAKEFKSLLEDSINSLKNDNGAIKSAILEEIDKINKHL